MAIVRWIAYPDTDFQTLFSFFLRRSEPAHHRLPRHASASVPLRVEEDLAVPHIHRRRAFIVVHREIVVVFLGFQHFKPAVVSFEEGQRFFFVVHLPFRHGLHGVVRVLEFLECREDGSCAWMP